MNKEEKLNRLKEEAEKKFELLESIEERGLLETNKQARLMYEREKEKLTKIVDEIGELEKEERGNDNMAEMKKMETRSVDEFGALLRGEIEERAVQTTTQGASLIPENATNEIIKLMEEMSPAFQQVRKFPTVHGTLKIPSEYDNSQSASFVGEGANLEELNIALTDVKLTQKRLGAAIVLSKQLINDSVANISEYAKELLSRRMVRAIEKSIFTGSTLDEFRGIKNASLKTEDVQISAATGVVSPETLIDLHLRLNPAFLDGAAFYMSRPFFNKVAKLSDNNGHFYLQNGVVNGKITYTLFGFPVHVTDALDAGTVAGETPVVFANLREAYAVMVKQEMGIIEVAQDTTNALRGSKMFVVDAYMDGAVYNPQAAVRLEVIA